MEVASLKLALKRLSQSDLSLFQQHYRFAGTHQKGINLNKSVLINRFYPDLEPAVQYNLSLYLYGPGTQYEEYIESRKVLLQEKNWRLDGAYLIPGQSPANPEARFAGLQAGDLMLMGFIGEDRPGMLVGVVVSQADPVDAALHRELSVWLGGPSMTAMSFADLEGCVQRAAVPADHPARLSLLDADREMEETVRRGTVSPAPARRGRPSYSLNPEALKAARKAAEKIGQLGEKLVNILLESQVKSGNLRSHEWASRVNAVAPYDFEVDETTLQHRVLDVKSTSGEFGRSIYLSQAELQVAAQQATPYDLYRVYDVTANTYRLRIARDIGDWARTVLAGLNGLPNGTTADSVSVDLRVVQGLAFGPEQVLRRSPNV